MFETASTIIKDALIAIEIMKKTGDKIRTLPWASHQEDDEEDDTLFVSTDRHLLRPFDVVEVDGVMYFIGLKLINKS